MAHDVFQGFASDLIPPFVAGTVGVSVRDVRNKPPVPTNVIHSHLLFFDVTVAPPTVVQDFPISLLPGERFSVGQAFGAGVDWSYEVRIGKGHAREHTVIGGAGNMLTLTLVGGVPPIGTLLVVDSLAGGTLIPDVTKPGAYTIVGNTPYGVPAVGQYQVTVEPTSTDFSGIAAGATARLWPFGSGNDIVVTSIVTTAGMSLNQNVGQFG